MKLLVTGCCGFIGSNFVNSYFKQNKDVEIVNLDAMYYHVSDTNIEEHIRNSSRYHLIKGNVSSFDLLLHILEIYKIDTVIHFASQSHVENSCNNALQYTYDNIIGTHTLLEACRKYNKINKFIHISTDEVYGESMISEKKHEDSVLCPTSPYAATKAGAELIAKSYYHSFNLPIIIIRTNNVYGKNQYPEKLIPKFITQLLNNNKLTIQGNGNNARSFLHVNDACSALKLILDKGKIGEIYNIGSNDNEHTIIQIAHILIEKIKKTTDYDKWIAYIEDRPFNDKRYHISNQKVKNLGWSIDTDFDTGISELIDELSK